MRASAALGELWLAWLLVGAWLVVGAAAADLDARGRWILGAVLAGLAQLAVVSGVIIAARTAGEGGGVAALGPVVAVLTVLAVRRWWSSRGLPQLAVRAWGRGAPVVFLHGAGGSSRYWRRIAGAHGAHRGIAPDLLGFGRSPKPRSAAYDVDCHVAALVPVVPPGSVVVAHSTGAVVAAALAVARPDLVRSLLLLGVPAFPDPQVAADELGRLGPLAAMTVHGRRVGWALCQVMCTFRPIVTILVPLVVRDVPPSIAADGTRHTWVSYRRTVRSVVVEHRVAEDLRRLHVPVRILHGADDRTAPLGHLEVATRGVQGLDLRVVPGDHHLALRSPELVARHLAELLAAPPVAAQGRS